MTFFFSYRIGSKLPRVDQKHGLVFLQFAIGAGLCTFLVGVSRETPPLPILSGPESWEAAGHVIPQEKLLTHWFQTKNQSFQKLQSIFEKGNPFPVRCVRQPECQTRDREQKRGSGKGVSENSFGNFQAFLFHPWKCGARYRLCPQRTWNATFLQNKVIVGSGVHGVEYIGIVWDTQLWSTKGKKRKTRRTA